MANIHLKTTRNGGSIDFKDPTMPKYVGARATVTRNEDGVTIWMSDYKGTTTETIAEAIADIVTNNDGSLTFVLPDGREITTDSLKGEQGPAGADGQDGQDGQDGTDGVGIASIEKTATSGLVDTYTITYTDSDTDTFTVTNGADGAPGTTDYNELENKPNLATVATSGSYNDLSNKPTIPAKNIWYATCSSAADTVAKVATSSSGDFVLATGNMVRVRFTYGNTATGATLSIDGCTATGIYRDGHANTAKYMWANSEVIDLVYDEGKLIMSDGSAATTSTYGVTKLNSATNSESTTEAATPSAVKAAYDLANGKSTVSVSQITSTGTNIADITVNGTTTHLYAPSSGGSDDVYVTNLYTGTYSDVLTAYQAGKAIFLLDPNSNAVAPLASVALSSGHVTSFNFVHVIDPSTTLGYHLNSSSQWSVDDTNTPIANTFQAYYGSTTSAEIEAAYQLGKIVFVEKSSDYGTKVYQLTNRISSTFHEFACIYDYDGYYVTPMWETLICNSDFWSYYTSRLARYSDMPTRVSDLNNDSGYLTLATLPTYNGGVS